MTTHNQNGRAPREDRAGRTERGRWSRASDDDGRERDDAYRPVGRTGTSEERERETYWVDQPYRTERARPEGSIRPAGVRPIGAVSIGPHRGKGPLGYQRSDDRIRELVCEALAEDDQVDATQIEVTVSDGIVTLSGAVPDRPTKRMAEDAVDRIWGVRDVHNHLELVAIYRGNRLGGRGVGGNEL